MKGVRNPLIKSRNFDESSNFGSYSAKETIDSLLVLQESSIGYVLEKYDSFKKKEHTIYYLIKKFTISDNNYL